jgi:D-3-phosphoglycerate dehydrogenase
MPTHRVLVSCPLILDAIDRYADRLASRGIEYDVAAVDQQLTESDLLEIIEPYDGILAGDDELSRRVIANAPKLTVISKCGIGTDNIDFEAADEHGVSVYNTPGAFDDEVADVVVGYAIMLTRQLHHIDAAVRSGDWACPQGTSLAGKTFGVIGVGNIGSAVVRRANALGMTVLGNDVEPISEDLRQETGIRPADKDELLRESSVVSLNCALTEATQHLIGSEELDKLGSDSYLINTARGGLIDQPALVEALQNGRLGGAALDVFDEEPLPPESPLTELDNVILGSHNAQNTAEAVERVHDRAVENLIRGLVDEEA